MQSESLSSKQLLIDIVKTYLTKGGTVELELDKTTKELIYCLIGFYKSGRLELYFENNSLRAKTRYGSVYTIQSWDDIVEINFDWWKSCMGRYDGWKNPEQVFIEDFINKNYIDVEETTVYHIKKGV